jgi:hypothetical protein
MMPLAFTTACSSSSSYLTHTNRMMSSETEGQFGISAEVGVHNLNRVYITDDISNISVNDSGHHMEDMITTGFDGNFGVLDFLDVGLNYDFGVPPMAVAKLQLIGDSKRQAEADNFSFSVYASLGYDSSFTDTDTDTDIFTGETPAGVVHRNGHGVYEAGGIFGYRTSRSFIFLLGGSVLWQDISGSQVMAPGDTPISFDDHSRFTEVHFGGIFNFGTNVNRGFFITPMTQWGYIDSFGYRSYGMNVQANFGYKFK